MNLSMMNSARRRAVLRGHLSSPFSRRTKTKQLLRQLLPSPAFTRLFPFPIDHI